MVRGATETVSGELREKAMDYRYARQVVLREFGPRGQEKLLASSVLCVGAGGLGSPLLIYLAAAGVGRIGIADADRVDLGNLQRQIIYTTCDIGKPKAVCAARRLAQLNGDLVYEPIDRNLVADNARDLISRYDLVADCTDNFEARFLMNDTCFELRKPLVSAAVLGFEGYLAFFPMSGSGPCLRCMAPEAPPAELRADPASRGIMGVMAGAVGVLEAFEAIKCLAGFGENLAGKLLVFDGLGTSFRKVELPRDPDCPLCGSSQENTR